ncbi:energy transducer TonB [Lysobacter solisilvae (ex Woo and Kim 2020)]|uniref:Protein TonB n=1 Tax=Agrilutibacter terrestris TaxID=2865112 RepID=A0A7H0G109_9GAMM|nr:energy transducer TonB [Lysobacter terrestris]QNP41975.1 energy transducer TonB [Lysobacter terrestris]
MISNHSEARSVRRPATLQFIAVLTLGLALAACGKDQPAEPAADATAAATAPAPTPATAVSSQVAAMTPEQLREAASKAYAENRLYAPAGDNAVEYYLALRDKTQGDAAVASALTDLLPMTVIAIEQSVNRDDFSEAKRLSALLEKADAQHPALARLKASIAAQEATAAQRAQALTAEEEAKRQKEIEDKRLADQKKQQDDAAKKLAATQQANDKAAADRAAADKAAADKAAADKAAADKAVADRRAAEQRNASAASAAPAASDLRPISMPAPKFPAEALRAGQSGSVLVEYTVGTDGTVTAARVVRSNPARVFDREAVNAVRKWRFQPVASPVTTRREISFNPQG